MEILKTGRCDVIWTAAVSGSNSTVACSGGLITKRMSDLSF